MPIYAYRCSACGHAQDVLQKMSDPLLTVCPACGQATYVKQVTAAGFQLKGSGWYVTDFRDGNKGAAKPAADGGTDKPADGADPAKAADPGAGKAGDKAADPAGAKASPPSDAKAASPAPAPAPAAAKTPAPPTSS
jgi:putative FmdB family regulatory protein